MKQIHFRSQEVAPNFLFAVGLEKGAWWIFAQQTFIHLFIVTKIVEKEA